MNTSLDGGRVFSIVHQASSLAAAGAVAVGITAPASAKIKLLSMVINTSANTVKAELFENISYTGGSAKTPVNLNRNSAAVSTLTAATGVTATTSGVPLDSVVATVYSGSTTSGIKELILDYSEDYVIEITNIGASTATDVDLVLTYIETTV